MRAHKVIRSENDACTVALNGSEKYNIYPGIRASSPGIRLRITKETACVSCLSHHTHSPNPAHDSVDTRNMMMWSTVISAGLVRPTRILAATIPTIPTPPPPNITIQGNANDENLFMWEIYFASIPAQAVDLYKLIHAPHNHTKLDRLCTDRGVTLALRRIDIIPRSALTIQTSIS